MARAGYEGYVLIQTEIGKAAEVAAALRSVPGVVFADPLQGCYDVIARVAGDTVESLGNDTVRAIGKTPHVVRTLTCITCDND